MMWPRRGISGLMVLAMALTMLPLPGPSAPAITAALSYSDDIGGFGPDNAVGVYTHSGTATGPASNEQVGEVSTGYSGTLIRGDAPLLDACGDAYTPIYTIQGSSLTSPLVGTEVALEGIVVGDFQNNTALDNGNLRGFHVQDPAGDGDPATSDGIFVYGSATDAVDVAIGDRVRVRGTVSEYNGLTEVTAGQIWLCSSGNSVAPTALSLPVSSLDDWERYEGMLVTFPQALVISDYSDFDRYNEIVLTSVRQIQPTAVYEPGSPEALAMAQSHLLSRIMLDDGRSTQNSDPAIHPNGLPFDLTNLFRGGDTVANVTGVVDYSYGIYRVQPTEGADYVAANPRTATPEDTGGSLNVASFNVLNYFITTDTGVPICGPGADQECRGADTAEEFTRQRAKIVAALAAMNADVVGLIEIENHPGDMPTADLVAGLNDMLGAGTYAYIATGATGIDAIRQALIFKPASVTPVGAHAILVDQAFTNPLGYLTEGGALDEMSRPALAQTFRDIATGGSFTVVVNHLKSRGSPCDTLLPRDEVQDDDPVQGNCSLTRTLGAQALVDWLVTDPTGSGDPDVLVIGDLNAYAREAPVDVLLASGYTDAVAHYLGDGAYTYVYDGQVGSLDHGLAGVNHSLADQITGVTVWHINADEPDLIDYDMSYKKPAQEQLYAPDPYRSSDHDPVLIGLNPRPLDVRLWLPLVCR
jgi:predicted extracellular nuclease